MEKFWRQDTNGGFFEDAGLFAFSTTGAMLGMHGGQKHRMTPGTGIRHHIKRDCLVDHRANAVTNVAAQAKEVKAGFVVDQYRNAHFCLVDIDQRVVECLGRASLDAGNVLAHLARNIAGIEKRGTGGNRHAASLRRRLD